LPPSRAIAADVFGSGGGNGGAQSAIDVKSLRTHPAKAIG
jgi:hypothetical protein